MDTNSDKHGSCVTDTRFYLLSLQLFGESENSSKDFQKPFVDLSQNLNRKSALINIPVTQPTVNGLPRGQKRCLVCYSFTANLESKRNWDELNEFLNILQGPVCSLNDNRRSISVQQLKKKSVLCLCMNCNAAGGKLIKVYRQMRKLEEEVKVFQAKFRNAIKLSKAIAETEVLCKSWVKSSNEPIEQLRTSLIGGTEKWDAVKDKWMGYVNFEKEIIGNDLEPDQGQGILSEENDEVKLEVNLEMDNLESERNFGEDDNHDAIAFDDLDNHKESTQEQVDPLEKNVEPTDKQLVKPYKKRGPKPGHVYLMTPKAIRYRALRAKYSHLSNQQMRAYLKTLPKIERGKPRPKLAIEDLKQSKSNASHIKWRKTYGKTMSYSAYREMKRKELVEVQKIKVDKIASLPRRSNISVAGFRIKWEDKGNGILVYSGVEVRANQDGTFSCILCESNGISVKPVKTRNGMCCHIKRMHIAVTDGHACDKCDAKFYYHHQLLRHIRGKHVGWQCEICGTSFPYKTSLDVHNRVKHLGIRPHVCEHCGKGFATKKDLTIHVRRHTGERPFVCHVCAQTFIEKQSMKKHIKKLHPGEPFEEPVKQNIKISI